MASPILRLQRPSLALFVALLWSFSSPAFGATTEIGAVAEVRAGELPAPVSMGGFAVQIAANSGSYAVPAGYTTITSWSHSAGATPGALTFKVYRPTGGLREFVAIASDTRFVSAGSVQTFPVQIPVAPGDVIGLSADEVELAYETFLLTDQVGFFGIDVSLGATRATDGDPFPEFKLAVSATVATPEEASTPGVGPAAGSYALPSPQLQRLGVSPRAFRAARSGGPASTRRLRGFGTKVSYRVDMPATVRFKVQRASKGRRTGRGSTARCVAPTRRNRRARSCTRYTAVPGTISRTARAGDNSFYFTGRIGGRRLARSSYRLMATPTASGLTGNTLSRAFRITR